jgi:acetylornithine/N-succinyldiaminopimelate aminotransferase
VQAARELCDRHNALLIFDEVQTGNGRTGDLYGYMNLGVTPDILTTAKGLGGGFPVGAMLTTSTIASSFGVGTHGSTYGGNPLACAVAETVLDIVSNSAVLEGVCAKHQRFVTGLNRINEQYAAFSEIRGKGLLLGSVLNEPWRGQAKAFVQAAQAEGLFVLVAGPDVVRMAPSLIIPEELIEEGLRRFERAVAMVTNEAAPRG